jgi:hypothetical protein
MKITKQQLKQMVQEEVDNAINEASATWEVKVNQTTTVQGVEIKKGSIEVVTARTTYLAIKKALVSMGVPKMGPHYSPTIDANVKRK